MQNNEKSFLGMDANVAAGLAYLPFCFCHLIFSIGILATDKVNKVARFHAVQSLLLSAVLIASYVVTFVLVMVIILVAAAADVPALGMLSFLIYVIFMIVVLAALVGLIIACIKGFQGQIFKLPIIGNMADKWSN